MLLCHFWVLLSFSKASVASEEGNGADCALEFWEDIRNLIDADISVNRTCHYSILGAIDRELLSAIKILVHTIFTFSLEGLIMDLKKIKTIVEWPILAIFQSQP